MCTYIKIDVIYKKEHLPGSPFIINKKVYPDDCMCPNKNVHNFLETWMCNQTPSLLKKQLDQFKTIDWDKRRKQVSNLIQYKFSIHKHFF